MKSINLLEITGNYIFYFTRRPTTGEAPVNAIQAGCYNNIKEELQKYLAVLEEKNARMKDYITKFHNKTENQLKEINSIETAVSETED